jgi:AmiR/NasT family two-component response regulator
VSYTPVSPVPVRVLLFKNNPMDALHLRLAIDMSPIWCEIRVLGEDLETVGLLQASIRAGNLAPEMILFDADLSDPQCSTLLGAVRESNELKGLPLVVIGDADTPECPALARSHGATAFVRRPVQSTDLVGVGREIARIWSDHESRRSAALSSLS